jgi:copper chaperone CopZ
MNAEKSKSEGNKINYSIDIKGMHCIGCANLIKMTLEECRFEEVQIDQNNNFAEFAAINSKSEVKDLLDKVFTHDLIAYSYSNLNIIN